MYVTKVQLENIRSIKKFEMNFPNPAGWHVIIGDNGSGKTSVVQAIAYVLVGKKQVGVLRFSEKALLMKNINYGHIAVEILPQRGLDKTSEPEVLSKADKLRCDLLLLNHNLLPKDSFKDENFKNKFINNIIKNKKIFNDKNAEIEFYNNINFNEIKFFDFSSNWIYTGNWTIMQGESKENGWFSSGFGPFRRFSGGKAENDEFFKSNPRLGAHLSLFGDDVALTEVLEWIKELDYERLKNNEISQVQEQDSSNTFYNLLDFINESQLLPHGLKIEGVEKNGVVFIDANKNRIDTFELSDGYRSILSLTFELIRQLVRVYGSKAVFKNIQKGTMNIDLPGVVLIDEIDAHLHPSWQTQIGFWFTKYFPSLQFIVTTHSPLVCRACENGSIWRLAKPGSDNESGEITGVDRDRLIYGNILDAYGTELFGQSVAQSENALSMLKELADLNKKSFKGIISDKEKKRMFELKQILPTAE